MTFWHFPVSLNKFNKGHYMYKKTILCTALLVAILSSSICFAVNKEISSEQTIDNQRFDCVIRASLFVELSSQVRGVLETVNVERGDLVTKDQLVAKLMSGVETASVRLAKAKADMDIDVQTRNAEKLLRSRSYKQVEDLYNKKLASLREYDDAKTLSIIANFELKKAKELRKLSTLELERTKETLNLRYIKSPIDGVVVERMKSPGEYIEEQPVVKIAHIDLLHVEAIVPERQFNHINVGMEAKVYTENPDASYNATVIVVDPVIDAASGTFGVRLKLPNHDHSIPAGLRCGVSFKLK